MRLILHSCCAPCTTYSLDVLREEGHDIMGFFYNPNIHPYTEFQNRLGAYRDFIELKGLEAIVDDSYGLRAFMDQVYELKGHASRCETCYRMRLLRTALLAKEKGYDAFTTTLTISPYQNHDLIKSVGAMVSEEVGVPFVYYDFRDGYRKSIELSKELELYRQKYCGCIFSEEERYSPEFRKKKAKTAV